MHSDTAIYRIERLSPDNLSDLHRLYRAVYGNNRKAPDFQKKYATDWTGATYVGFFAYDEQGTPAAYYGVMPCFIRYNNILFLSAQSGDTMTHPSHRNKGLFVRLCLMTIELCREENILLLFGFPNQNSYPGFIGKLGWTTTETLQGFLIPVPALPLDGLSMRLPFLRPFYDAYSKHQLKKYLLPEKGITGGGAPVNGIHRDEAWFNYKTYSKTYVVQLGKAKAWIAIADTITIGDIQTQDLDDTLRRLRKLAARLGIRNMVFHTSPGTPLHQQFSQRHRPFTSFPVIFKDLGAGIPLQQLKFTFADIDTF